MVVAGGGENFVTATQHVLPHDLGRHVRVTRLGEIAVRGAANEPALALWIEPTGRLAIRNYRRERSALCAALLLLLIAARTVLLSAALSAAPPLVASAPAVVAMIALALLPAAALVLLASAAAIVLLIV
jgi:hypothetical protein